MKPLMGFRHFQIEERIAREFGDGSLKAHRYLFDQITWRAPAGWSERCVSPAELVALVRQIGRVIVLFDRNPDNYRLAAEWLRRREP